MSQPKTNQTPTDPISGEAKKTNVEKDRLSGAIRQVMQICYNAHLKAGEIFQGKIQRDYSFHRKNFIITYNEKGDKTREELFGKDGNYLNTFNDRGLQTESVHNKDGKLYQKTIFTYNDHGNQLEHKVCNADGSLYFKVVNKYNDAGKSLENIHYTGVEEKILSKTLYQYDDKGNMLSSIQYKADGTIYHQCLHKYNERGKMMEDITEYPQDPKSQFNRRITYQYNEQGDTIETIFYKADGSINSRYTHDYKYNEFGQVIENTSYSDGRMDTIHSHKYNPDGGQLIETVYRNANGSLRGNVIYQYDKEQCTKETHYEPDGSIERITIHHYDPQGKRIETTHLNADGSIHDFAHPKAAGETEECENDAHGNWIKKTTFYNKIPVNIFLRQIIYFDEPNENTQPLIHPLANSTDTEDIEDTIRQTEELSDEHAQWLVEAANSTPETFSILRYYALRYKDAPSVIAYTGPYIEAIALLHELKEKMDAQEIHSYSTVWHNQGEQLMHYTLIFPGRNYLLHAMNIGRQHADEFEVPEFVDTNYDGNVHTSQFQLLRPSHASGKRDWYFEEELNEYIRKCSLSKKPDKPVINMIEVRGNSFAMVEHAADDDFEIKDLDVNYGYGFAKFHDELMQRFNTSTKGLVLFHGEPGTGKTYYIRHLLRKMVSNKKVVIYMPPNMVDHLVEPGFMTFLAGEIKDWANDGNFCVLLIEDAEPLLAKRQQGDRIQGVTNLLNLTDGILNDMLNLQIICTFNVDLKKLDSALLRPGRLIARKEFKKLGELDANLLAQRLGIKHHFKKPATLGEVYAMLKNKNTLIHDVEPDRDASTPIDDL